MSIRVREFCALWGRFISLTVPLSALALTFVFVRSPEGSSPMRQLLPFAIAALPAIIVGLRATAPGIPQGTALLISLLAMPLGYLAVNGNPSTLSIIFSALIGLGALGAWVTSLVTDVGARNRAWIAVHILSAIVMIALLASGTGPSESVTENVMGGLSTGVLLSWIWTATLTAAVTFTRPRQARLGAGST